MGRLSARLATTTCLVVLALVGAGCADEGNDNDGLSEAPDGSATSSRPANLEDLDGSTYQSTTVSGHDLVEGTSVHLSFEDDVMTASAGCNTMFGPFELDQDLLRWTDQPASSLIGCPDDEQAQDQWLTTLLTDGVTATLEESVLFLTSDEVTVELATESADDLDTVLGRHWTLVGTFADGATSRLPRHINRPFLTVGADGLARLNTGCNAGRTTVRVDGDQLVFGHATTTRQGCQGPAGPVEEALLEIVDQGRTDYVELRERLLIVLQEDRGLVFNMDHPPDS